MSNVTREDAFEFIKLHLNYDEAQEKKLSEEDATVQKLLKVLKPDSQKIITELADGIVKIFGKDISEEKLKNLFDRIVREFYNQLLTKSSLTPIALFGIGGGLFGKMLTRGGVTGLIMTLLSALAGVLIGALCANKPDPIVVMFSLKLTQELSKRYPESKELIARAMGNALFDRCYYWANAHGGWAQGIYMTLQLNALEEGTKHMLTPSFLRATR